ncbi:MAG: methyltransferase domain-containing protein [Candidatus Margulisbacteria bacterium]|nr:methyltransferase domain-containing protein [Candidatus Margulisiibacteriota bacterium]MBU1617375.1 methyltransferase domain-containing protein [Candidatus Margulisiibacteriota bacterium]
MNKHHKTSWNDVAGWYDQLVGEKGSDYHEKVIVPGTLKMLVPRRGEKILDLACGQGILCRELAKAGTEVVGIDAAPNLIKAARERSTGHKSISYFVSDAADLRPLADSRFDAVACVMAIQNIEPLGKVLAESARVLKKGGRFLIVTSHPCFRIPRQSGWGFDDQRQMQYRRVDSYLSELKIPIKMHPGYDPGKITWTFHRPLGAYFSALNKAGFAVSRLEEWASHRHSLPGAKAKAENRSRQEIPLFLALLAVKY